MPGYAYPTPTFATSRILLYIGQEVVNLVVGRFSQDVLIPGAHSGAKSSDILQPVMS